MSLRASFRGETTHTKIETVQDAPMHLDDLETTETKSSAKSPNHVLVDHFKACFEEERRVLLGEIQSLQAQLDLTRSCNGKKEAQLALASSRKKQHALRSEVSSLQNRLSKSEQQVRDLQEKLVGRTQLTQRLNGKIDALEEAKQHSEQTLTAEKCHLEQKLKFAEDHLGEVEARSKARLEEEECRSALMRNELQVAQEEFNSMSRKQKKAELMQQDLRAKLITTTKRFDGMTAKLEKLRKKATLAEEERDLARAEADQLNIRATRLGASTQGSHLLEKQLKEAVAKTKRLEQEKKSLADDLETHKMKFGTIARAKARMDQQLLETEKKAQQLHKVKDDTQVKLAVVESELETCKRRLTAALEETLTLENENAQLVSRIQEIEQGREQCTRSRVSLDGQVAKLEARCSENERKLSKALEEKETYHKAFLKSQHAEARAKSFLEESQNHVARLQIQMNQLRDNAATFSRTKAERDSAIEVLTEEKKALHTRLQEVDHTLRMAQEDILSTRLRYIRADELFRVQRIEAKGIKDKLGKLSRENQLLRNELVTVQTRLVQANSNVSSSSQRIGKESLRELKDENKRLSTKIKEQAITIHQLTIIEA